MVGKNCWIESLTLSQKVFKAICFENDDQMLVLIENLEMYVIVRLKKPLILVPHCLPHRGSFDDFQFLWPYKRQCPTL